MLYSLSYKNHTWNWGLDGVSGVCATPLRLENPKKRPPLKSSGIATTLKPDSNPPKNFGDRPLYA